MDALHLPAMPGSRPKRTGNERRRATRLRVLLGVASVGLAGGALLTLRGVGGFYVSPVASFASAVAALAIAASLPRSSEDRTLGTLRDLGLGVAIAACAAAAVAIVAVGGL